MYSDRDLQDKVLQALEFEPGVNAAAIGVTVDDGVVTLRGTVDMLREKWLAERCTRHVHGVRAIANDVEVDPGESNRRTDPAIAQAAANALEWDSAIPAGAVKATVRHGWVTLTGDVTWQHQRDAAERAITHLGGVRGVNNSILVKPPANAEDVKARVEAVPAERAVP